MRVRSSSRIFDEDANVGGHQADCMGERSLPVTSKSGNSWPISIALVPLPVALSRICFGRAWGLWLVAQSSFYHP